MKTSTLMTLLATALLGTSAHAFEMTLCLEQFPLNWTDVANGEQYTSMKGPAVLVNVEANRVTWIGTGGSVYLHAKRDATTNKLIITKVSGSAPTAESIVTANVDESKVSNVAVLKLDDSMGGNGYMTVMIPKEGTKYLTGRAMWMDDGGSSESFGYCTTDIVK